MKDGEKVVAHAKGPNFNLIYRKTLSEKAKFSIYVTSPSIEKILEGDLSMGYKLYGKGHTCLTELPKNCANHDYSVTVKETEEPIEE